MSSISMEPSLELGSLTLCESIVQLQLCVVTPLNLLWKGGGHPMKQGGSCLSSLTD